ncbi:MAG: peptidylprolyl isomerase [Bacteroidota bacterium]
MRKILIYGIVILLISMSCSVQKPVQETESLLFSVGGQNVSKDEFKYAFLKNYKPSDTLSVDKEVTDYLDLYVRFKLKVKEARERKYHEREKYINELKAYQEDLAKPYLTENKVTDELIQEAYDRMKTEVKASHILISAKTDSVAAKKKILEVKALAEKGLSFDSLASIYSSDPSAKSNGGNLGYFTSMQMVYPFESAAYQTEVGKISDVVTTRFGYHILKVFDKRPSQGKVKVAHIMLRASQGATAEDNKKLEEKINAIYQQAVSGDDWNQLTRDFSQDARSKNQGGELPWISTGNFVAEFEDVAFAMNEVGGLSKPFRTIYGWHIIKLLEKKGVGTLEEVKPEISNRIQRDSRSQIKNKEVLSRLKIENAFVKLEANVANTLRALNEKDTASIAMDTILFTLQSKAYKNADFLSLIDNSTEKTNDNLFKYNQFEEKSILKFESEQLEVKYPDYANLLNEYRDGILLFDIMDEEIWRKASQDSTGLKSFYEQNKVDYTKYNVKKAVVYSTKDQNVLDKVKEYINDGGSREDIMNTVNENAPLLLQSVTGLFEKGENKLVDQAGDEQLYETTENDKFYLVQIQDSKDQVIPKLQNIRGRLISDYQDELEEIWIKELRAKYVVKTNEKTLKEVINEVKSK